MTDPIADLITRINNAIRVRKKYITVPYSKIKSAILKILKDKNLIQGFKITESGIKKNFIVYLKYDEDGEAFIDSLKRISKPGRRVYAGYKDLKPLRSGFAFRIISTSRGIMTDEEAKKRKLGGEVICEVY
jgi:small subunit ribosomal protein S8